MLEVARLAHTHDVRDQLVVLEWAFLPDGERHVLVVLTPGDLELLIGLVDQQHDARDRAEGLHRRREDDLDDFPLGGGGCQRLSDLLEVLSKRREGLWIRTGRRSHPLKYRLRPTACCWSTLQTCTRTLVCTGTVEEHALPPACGSVLLFLEVHALIAEPQQRLGPVTLIWERGDPGTHIDLVKPAAPELL